jgi:hypothetical protein
MRYNLYGRLASSDSSSIYCKGTSCRALAARPVLREKVSFLMQQQIVVVSEPLRD